MIPLVSGNLSVEYLMSRVGAKRGVPVPPPGSTRDEIAEMAALGFAAVEDYIAWGAVEREEGSFDWSFHVANLELCRRHRLKYVVYPWLHVVPKWWLARADFVGFRCLEHDLECSWPSTFAPATLDHYRRFYGELKVVLGGGIDAICVGFPADYGEVGYPTGIGAWVSPLVAPRDHVHVGSWAGDRFARAAFDELAAARPAADRRLLFADFYVDAMTGFVERALAVVRELFPDKPLWIKVGHAGESLAYGLDVSALVRAAARHGAGVRTTQATLPTIHQKRIASACRHFAVPLATEPPVNVGREAALERLFNDATSGASEYFEYPEQMVGARDLIARYGHLLDGELAECDVGLFFAGRELRLHPELGLPPVLFDLGESVRDLCDFELIDERLIDAGALANLRVLVLLEGTEFSNATQESIVAWVARGGTLLVGPDVAIARGCDGPLASLLQRAPAADDLVELHGDPAPSMLVRLGVSGDSLRLAGEWHAREEASQFRGTPPAGEFARWTARRGAALFPVRTGARYLLEIEGWVHPAAVHLDHAVSANGVRVGRMTRGGLQRFAAWLPDGATAGRELVEIALESEPLRPIDLGIGADPRELGVAVLSLRLTEEHALATSGRDVEPPRLKRRVRERELDARGTLRHGAGRVIVSRERPLITLLALIEHAVRRDSRVVRGLPAQEGRTTVFPTKVLEWNRRDPARGLVVFDRRAQSETKA